MHLLIELRRALAHACGLQESLKDIFIEPPPEFLQESFDASSRIGYLKAGKASGKKPLEWAEEIKRTISVQTIADKIEVHPPAYLNFRFNRAALSAVVRQALEEGGDYPKISDARPMGAPQEVLLEFCSANPTGPLHFGHARGSILGDTLKRIYEHLGTSVKTEYYVNDVGMQIERLGKSLAARYRQKILGQADFSVPEDGYLGEYLVTLAEKLGPSLDPENFGQFSDLAKKDLLAAIEKDLEGIGVGFDRWFCESDLHKDNRVTAVIERLRSLGFVTEKDGAIWFETKDSSKEDKERVLRKKDGKTTYFASDLAYHQDKFSRAGGLLINIWGADHHGYVPRMKLGLAALGLAAERFEVILVQMVRLMRNGQPVVLSKRSGDYLTLKEIAEEVGNDALRFFLNSRSPNAQLDFDLEAAKKKSSENPVYLVQYAHARIVSIQREKEARRVHWPQENSKPPFELEEDAKSRLLVVSLAFFPEAILSCALRRSPHYLTNYLVDLARTFHNYYETHPILSEKNDQLAWARYKLCEAARLVIANGLGLLGISAPERM
ncbi:MAG: arginine--tRNA ligase [Elusimicrobia bacterium]|nr:arginine--tRNA ligase [Elusimicrobiota bacterium]